MTMFLNQPSREFERPSRRRRARAHRSARLDASHTRFRVTRSRSLARVVVVDE
jgi:hypothetical protein